MIGPVYYLIAADLILAVHATFVLFVVLGLVLTLIGGARGWSWVKNPWFRLSHLFAIGIVVAQAWIGTTCPLTSLEVALRSRAGDAAYSGSFISHWVDALIFYEAPLWAFAICYTGFGVLIAASWIIVPPRSWTRPRRDQANRDGGAP